MQVQAPSSAEVLALRKLGRSVDVRWVEWAISMLVEGHDTPSLRILAGESRPFNQFEMAALVDRTFAELGLSQFETLTQAVVAYAAILVQKLLDGVAPMGVALREIAQLCIEFDYFEDIYDFYLLRFAREDLQVSDVQYYWPDANRDNIDELIRDYCKEWISKHQSGV